MFDTWTDDEKYGLLVVVVVIAILALYYFMYYKPAATATASFTRARGNPITAANQLIAKSVSGY